MSYHRSQDPKFASSSSHSNPPSFRHFSSSNSKNNCKNVFLVLARREISPRTKHQAKKLKEGASKYELYTNSVSRCDTIDPKLALFSWAEAQSFQHLSAKYCPLLPPPRSTIAAAFSSHGKTLASTHGDHTVKIIDSETGNCLKELSGHRRTPWVVSFHPLHSDIVASGSLDHELRLWDANTSDMIVSYNFYRPVASLSFHAQGEILAVATGHKLFIWNYNKRGEEANPVLVLRTRRSLRAVHFHPHGAPLLLTAEVNNIDSSDSPLTVATSSGFLHYPPAVFIANSSSPPNPNFLPNPNFPPNPNFSTNPNSFHHLVSRLSSSPCVFWAAILKDDGHLTLLPPDFNNFNNFNNNYENADVENQAVPMDIINEEIIVPGSDVPMLLRNAEGANYPYHFNLLADLPNWELPPFWQGWLLGQTQSQSHDNEPTEMMQNPNLNLNSRVSSGRVGNPNFNSNPNFVESTFEIPSALLAAGSAAELPCTVKLKVWQHEIKEPCLALGQDKCRLTISHAVLCSEMGAHISPCGRYLVACVACLMPPGGDQASQLAAQPDASGSSPTRHPSFSHRIIYELRIYSLEEATFGVVLSSRAIRAAHCLTSIQFSPTSEHILLAYGRRHNSLLRSVVMDGDTTIPIYTILEVYRVCDMELVRVLPSAEDEVNVACFHPSPGGGIVYGTKEGKLRILKYDGPANAVYGGLNLEESIVEV
ncbi:hypothetical protein LUZ60_012233 [Juncus effusus]|nr:hypothetical protein LUZ60_012233 [Juncus effusus]